MTRRRELLRYLATGAVPLLAGCAGGGTTPESTPATTPTAGGGTPTPTATEEDTGTETGTESPTPTDTESPTPTATAAPSSVGATVTLRNYFFSPVRAAIAPGEAVKWKNESSGTYASHTVTSAQFNDNAEQWDFDRRLGGGESVTHTFEDAGIYEYYCKLHGESRMCGVVLVGDATQEQSLPCE